MSRLLEGYGTGPSPVTGHGLLERIGGSRWQASGLGAKRLVAALGEARADEIPLRLEVSGPDHQQLPWELLFHEHEQLRFLARRGG